MSYRIEAWKTEDGYGWEDTPNASDLAQYLPDVARVLAEFMADHEVVVVTKLGEGER